MNTTYKVFVVMVAIILSIGLTEAYKRHIPKMMSDMDDLKYENKLLENRVLLLENKIKLAIKVDDGVYFLNTFTFNKEE